MIVESYYLSNAPLKKVLIDTNLSTDELCIIVGRFAKHSHRAGLLRGKIVIKLDGSVEIRKCFGNKLLWKGDIK